MTQFRRYISGQWMIPLAVVLFTTGCISVRSEVTFRDEAGPLRHIVLIHFKKDTEAADIDRVLDALAQLQYEIDEIDSFEWGVEVSGRDLNKNFTHGSTFTFDDQADLEAYRVHPAHVHFVELATPYLEEIFVFDYYARRN